MYYKRAKEFSTIGRTLDIAKKNWQRRCQPLDEPQGVLLMLQHQLSSVGFTTGSDVSDYLQQAEHLWQSWGIVAVPLAGVGSEKAIWLRQG